MIAHFSPLGHAMLIRICLQQLRQLGLLVACWLFLVSHLHAAATDAAAGATTIDAEALYNNLQDRIFQIQVIDLASDKRMSLGTGFRVSADGLIATNYHVIAEYLRSPEKIRVEYLDHTGQSGVATVRDIDVIHDLAIIQATLPGTTFLPFTQRQMSKGARIFAIGNPRDLGMGIIEGNYNGLLDKSLYQKILFSGSLNPGMSGGPALNRYGEVIGVNVSTAGDELSFLVPVNYLRKLLESVQQSSHDHTNLNQRITEQLLASQEQAMKQLLKAKWKTTKLDDLELPAELTSYFKCWGQTEDKPNMLYTQTSSACASSDSIYIAEDFDTGSIDFRYDFLSSEQLNSLQFYNLYTEKFSAAYGSNQVNEQDVDNYRCHTSFIELADHTWKTAFCSRAYKRFSGLHDIALSMASLGNDKKGLIISMNAAGLSQPNAMALVKKFMEHITWQN